MKVTKRENHDELMKDEFYSREFNETMKQAKFLESLGVGTVIIEPSSPNDSWFDQLVFIEHKGIKFRVREDYYKKFSCSIPSSFRNYAGESMRRAMETVPALGNYTFYKLTAKKLIEKLNYEIYVTTEAKRLYDEKKNRATDLYEKYKEKLQYIADCFGIKCKETEHQDTIYFEMESNEILNPFWKMTRISRTKDNFNQNGADDLYKLVKHLKG